MEVLKDRGRNERRTLKQGVRNEMAGKEKLMLN